MPPTIREFLLSLPNYFFSAVEFLSRWLSFFFTLVRVFFGTQLSEESPEEESSEDFVDAEQSLSPLSEYFDGIEYLSASPEDRSAQQEAAQSEAAQPEAAQPALIPAVERKHFPLLIPSFTAIYVGMFIATMYVNNCPKKTYPPDACFPALFGRFGFQSIEQNPLLGPTPMTLIKLGGLYVRKRFRMHQPWRLFSNAWLHEGVSHLIIDIVGILSVGIPLEQKFGFVRIGLLYFISSLGGSIISALFIKSGVTVGASGALAGLTGGTISDIIIDYWTSELQKGVELAFAIAVLLINAVLTVLQHGDNFANLGGTIFGFIFGFAILARPPVNRLRCTVVSVVTIIGLLIGMTLLLKGINLSDHCSWCRYLDCVPFPNWSCKHRGVDCVIAENNNSLTLTCKANGRIGIYPLVNNNPPQSTEELCFMLCGV